MRYLVFLVAFCIAILDGAMYGQQGVPKKISYQSVLNVVVKAKTKIAKKGPYSMRFEMYDHPTAGTLMLSNDQMVTVGSKGVYTATIGEDGSNVGNLDESVFDRLLWLKITLLSGTDTRITYPYEVPGRVQLTSVPYALGPWASDGANVYYNSGNVGIGTTNPTHHLEIESMMDYPLHVKCLGGWNWTRGIRVQAPSLLNGRHLVLLEGGVASSTKNAAHVDFYHASAGSDDNRLSLGLYGVDDVINIMGNGRVGIGTTNPATKLHVEGDALVKSTGGSVVLNGSDGSMEVWGTDGAFIDLKDSAENDFDFRITQDGTSNLNLVGGNVGIDQSNPPRKLWVNGDAGGATGWYNDSDERLKKNIATIPGALQKVKKLRGVNFEWKDVSNHPAGLQMGLIAQEAIDVVPEVVDKSGEYYSIQYGSLVALLIEAIKEQQKEIDELKQLVKPVSSLR